MTVTVDFRSYIEDELTCKKFDAFIVALKLLGYKASYKNGLINGMFVINFIYDSQNIAGEMVIETIDEEVYSVFSSIRNSVVRNFSYNYHSSEHHNKNQLHTMLDEILVHV